MKKRILIIVGVIILILVSFGLFTSYVDSARVRNGVEPKYVIKLVNKSGNKVTYYGLGYKVKMEKNISAEIGPILVKVEMYIFDKLI